MMADGSSSKTRAREGPFVGAVDQGTTSSRFFIFDQKGNPVASHQVDFKQIYPQPGWHEQDPKEILSSVETCISEASYVFARQGNEVADIKAIGITNQRETTLVWDSTTGEPLYNAIVWPDTRTSSLVRDLKSRPGSSKLQEICGLPFSTYPSAVKLLWLLQNVSAVREAYDNDRLIFGTVDTWLLYNFNGGRSRDLLVTDVTNASRTMFLNLHTLEYDDSALGFFDLQKSKIKLPKVKSCSDPKAFGLMTSGPLEGTPITGCLGDQSAALVGQCRFSPGEAKNTYGTGCFLLYNVGEAPAHSKHGLLATVAYHLGQDNKPIYALEGSIATAGSAVKFLSENLQLCKTSPDIEILASTVDDSGGVVFVTAFSGLFAPYWIDDAKGTIFGITHHTQRGHIARATLEATCYQTKAILDAMEKDSGQKLSKLAVDGGMSNSDLCMQIQADIAGIPVDRPRMRETTALGAAFAAGFAVGIWKDLGELRKISEEDRNVFQPCISEDQREKMNRRWEHAVDMAKGWIDSS